MVFKINTNKKLKYGYNSVKKNTINLSLKERVRNRIFLRSNVSSYFWHSILTLVQTFLTV